jgi:glutamine amidotransferase
MKIAVVDYNLGNVRSILGAFDNKDARVQLTNDRNEILDSDGVVLPGVGAFKHGMESLEKYDLIEIIKKYIDTGKPFMGICLGMQMLFNESEEYGCTKGLSLIPGKVVKLPTQNILNDKLPHVSWKELQGNIDIWSNTILDGIENNSDMYFVHSYVAEPASEDYILSTTEYSGHNFCSTVKKDNIYGCQYHPEKSGKDGLKIINNFMRICEK